MLSLTLPYSSPANHCQLASHIYISCSLYLTPRRNSELFKLVKRFRDTKALHSGIFASNALTDMDLKAFVREALSQYLFAALPLYQRGRVQGKYLDSDCAICYLGNDATKEMFRQFFTSRGSKHSPGVCNVEALALAGVFAEQVQLVSSYTHADTGRQANQMDALTNSNLGMKFIESDRDSECVEITYNCGGLSATPEAKVVLFRSHFEMLVENYLKTQSASNFFIDQCLERHLVRIFTLVKRYDIFGALRPGHQASITAETMNVLRKNFKVSHECFASPFNRSLSTYNSMFFDCDFFFGSYGK